MKNQGLHRATILILAVAICSIISCGNDDSIIGSSSQPTKAIITSGNSAIRIDPLLFSGRVALLNKGEVVELLERSKTKSWVGDTNDFWYKVRRANGISGWTYGTNIRVLRPGTASMEQFIADFIKDDSKEMIKAITGKWWSVNSFGDFTSHCLEFYEDNKYKSYRKGSSVFIEGEYTFDLNKNQIIFIKGTTFGKTLDMIKRGQTYMLQKEMEDQVIRFKKIASEIKEEEKEGEKTIKAPDENKAE
ncbi:MAG: SH3 domain-containing protein [Spirochaetes bacterium]|nr:SH3 domain-containing protein [Spirochaetota bacterium]